MSDNVVMFRPNIIDINITVDAPRIMYHYGPNKARDSVKFSDYVQLGLQGRGMGVGFVYMTTTWFDAQNEGGSELKVFGNKGDKLRWRIQTLSMGGAAAGVPAQLEDAPDGTVLKPVAYQAFIRGFVIDNGEEYISTPQKKVEIVESWGFDNDGKIIRKPLVDVYWEAEVAEPGGQVTYHTPFNIFCDSPACSDNNDGGDDNGQGGGGGGDDGCGGYKHDPFIMSRQ